MPFSFFNWEKKNVGQQKANEFHSLSEIRIGNYISFKIQAHKSWSLLIFYTIYKNVQLNIHNCTSASQVLRALLTLAQAPRSKNIQIPPNSCIKYTRPGQIYWSSVVIFHLRASLASYLNCT